jgi:hypothetical protein
LACQPQLTGELLKNAREKLVAEISLFRDRCYAHLRIYVPSAAVEGEWIRTNKGFAIPVERLPELVEAVRRLREVASERTVAKLDVGREELRVAVRLYRDIQYIDARLYYRGTTDWMPSAKGVTVGVAFLEDFVRLVEVLAEAGAER